MISILTAHSLWERLALAATGSLVSAVWQGVLLAGAVALGLRLVPKTPAAVRFAIWFAVFAVVCALPIVAVGPHTAQIDSTGGHAAWLTLDPRWSLAIAALWVVASLTRAGTLVIAAFRVRALWRRAEPVELATRVVPATGRHAQVCVSDEVDRPSVIGFFSPKILIPRWLLQKLTHTELDQIVLHESGHLGRADDWLNLLQKLALVVFPLNPALVWVERRLCFERELACDERVLHTTNAPKAYAACLASLAEHRIGRRGLALALGISGALGRESELGQRVRRILARSERMRPIHARLVLGGAMFALVLGAVELSRCPQVVAFSSPVSISSGSSDLALVTPPQISVRPSAGRPEGYGYQPVVYRPDQAYGAKTMQRPTARNHVSKQQPHAQGMTNVIASQAPSAQRPTLSSPHASSVGWVIITSWSDSEAPRIVMTTAIQSSNTREYEQTQQDETTLPMPSPQLHPYAAVPVRGGWLVFQL